jgi:hypothetical protein
MSSSQAHLDLLIDIFDFVQQPARVLSKIKPPQLIEAIIQEFREIEYLADDPAQYFLARVDDGASLDDSVELGRQHLTPRARLVLRERSVVAPEGALPLSWRIYLREQSLGRVYRLPWQPAIVGRRAESQAQGEAQQIAVDLQPFPTGLRVSRRHLSIGESGGQLTVENLSNNPAFIQRAGEVPVAIEAGKTPLLAGDVILLERSQIALKVLLLPDAEQRGQDAMAAQAGQATTTDPQAAVEPGVVEGS